ncbi:MAG: MSMEG_4193 family putative phosphomutase [Actinomycetota bacterium]|nr:MSMEG_4193 family putative phosphomutase [Actinomycetota bacterium]
MALILLVRHAVTDVTGKRLYGRTGGISLSETGRAQADRLAERLSVVPLDAVYSSPLERCMETATAIAAGRDVPVQTDEGILEIDYGTWTGRPFTSLSKTRLWRQAHGNQPSAVRFPGGETLGEAQRRSVDAIIQIADRHDRGTVAVVTHGDVISLALAHFAGVHVDLFQRIQVAPASVSAVSIGPGGPMLHRVNDIGTLEDLGPSRRPQRRVRG